jgi:flagellar basal body-associated protein FliL
MKREVKRLWVIAAVVAVLCALSMAAGARMLSTNQVIGQVAADQDRARVQSFIDRTDAREKLQSMGIDPVVVKERLAQLTDREVHDIAQKLDTLPAGGDVSNRNLIVILLVVLLVVLLV